MGRFHNPPNKSSMPMRMAASIVLAGAFLLISGSGYVAPVLADEDPPEFITKWGGAQGSGVGQFDHPYGVAVASDGAVYVADSFNHRIQKFDGDTWTVFVGAAGFPGSGEGELSGPFGVAVGSDDSVYVADTYNHRIQNFDGDGRFQIAWGSYGTGEGQFSYPTGVAVDSDGNVYVADHSNHRIQKFDGDTWAGFAGTGSPGSGEGEFDCPFGVAVGSDGSVYVADINNHRIQKFDGEGALLTLWGSEGTGNSQFRYPSGVAVDSCGSVYVVDSLNNRMQKFDSDGAFLTKWGSQGSENAHFNSPCGVAADSDGIIYVADAQNHRIQAFGYLPTIDLALTTGWNMVSVPLELLNHSPTAVFPGTEAIYTWNPETKSYVTPPSIVPCCGYWVAVLSDRTITVAGAPVNDWECNIFRGWNMIGSVYEATPVAGLTTDEESDPLHRTAIYAWDPGSKSYVSAGEIEPGSGYWLATVADCELTLSPPE